jgi:hypothetical protein
MELKKEYLWVLPGYDVVVLPGYKTKAPEFLPGVLPIGGMTTVHYPSNCDCHMTRFYSGPGLLK